MPAPTDSAYLLALADPINLPNSRLLTGNNASGIHLDIGGAGGNATIQTVGQLNSLATLNVSGLYVLDASNNTFVGRSLINGDASIIVTNPNFAAGNCEIKVRPGSTVQQINLALNGITTATTDEINFEPGPGITMTISQQGAVAIDINEAGTGSVTEVDLTSSTGLEIGGSGTPVNGVVTLTVDLPALGNVSDVLTVTGASTIGWQAPAGGADWSMHPATQNVEMSNGSGTYGFYNLGTGNISWGATISDSPYLFATGVGPLAQRYIGANVGESNDNASGYVVLTNSIPGDNLGTPYGQIGSLLYGLGVNGPDGIFMYTDLPAPASAGEFELRSNDGGNQLPFWKPVAQGVVTLGALTTPVNWAASGAAFVADTNVTANTVVVVTPLEYITTGGGTKPVVQAPVGPFSVYVNTADNSGSGGFGLGYVIQGDTTASVDDTVTVAYYVVKY